MPDILDQLQAGQVAETNANLAQAQHQADWANWFTSTPPSEVLRQNLNLTSMIDSAVEQKQRILAQTDENAQRIYLNNKRFQAEQELQPLKVQHAQAQIDHETALTNAVGAHDLYLMDQDREEAADYAAMLGDIKNIEGAQGSPDYIKSIYTAALSHPKGAMSTAGRELINSHIQRHKSLTELQAEAAAAGVDVSGGTLDKSGNASIQFQSGGSSEILKTSDEVLNKIKEYADQGIPAHSLAVKGGFKVITAINRPHDIGTGGTLVDSQGNVIFRSSEQSRDSLRTFDAKLKGLGVSRNDLANADAWKTNPNGTKYIQGDDGKYVTLPANTLDSLQKEFQGLSNGATPAPVAHPVGSRAQKNGIWYVRGEDGVWKPEK